jgi:hypothetical protein
MKYNLYIVEELVHGVLELGGEGLVGGLVGHARVNVEVSAHNGEICRGALHQLHHLLRLQEITICFLRSKLLTSTGTNNS